VNAIVDLQSPLLRQQVDRERVGPIYGGFEVMVVDDQLSLVLLSSKVSRWFNMLAPKACRVANGTVRPALGWTQ
jgi:hypothetical protein